MALAFQLTPLTTALAITSAVVGLWVLHAASRAIGRTQGLSAWRTAAEGYKEQVTQLEGRLQTAEREIASLLDKVEMLEQRPDMTSVEEKFESELDPIRKGVEAILAEIAQR